MRDFFELGRILKPQGIAGEVKLEPYTDTLARFLNLKTIFLKKGEEYKAIVLTSVRIDNKYAYLKLSGITNREKAEKLRGTIIYIDRENAAPLNPGAYYIADLIGMDVYFDDGECIGKLTDILQTGAADIYVVRLLTGGSLSFPSIDGVIKDRNLISGKLIIDRYSIKEVGIYDN